MKPNRPLILISLLASSCLITFAHAAETYKVDPVHSSFIFRVKHFNVGFFYGRFNDVSGTFVLDEADPANSNVEVVVKTESIDTNNEMRERHLKSPDFFNVKDFPEMKFRSKTVKKIDEHSYEIEGDFTLLSVTKSITIKVDHTGAAKDPMGAYRSGFETVFNIKRSEHGMGKLIPGVSDEVRIIIGIEGIKQS